MRIRLLLLIAVFAALTVAGTASAATPRVSRYCHRTHHVERLPLRLGSKGKRTCAIQWLLAGQEQNVYRTVIHTYHGRIDGQYGPQTARAVKAAKYRLGYPLKNVTGRAGGQLFALLRGRQTRPLEWIGRASKRIAHAAHAQTSCSRRIVAIARSQIGVREVPDGSNSGARVAVFQRITGAFRAAWCASFAQWVIWKAGHGPIANRSAGVFYIFGWAHERAWVHAQPKPGALVTYLRNLGHMGVVESVTRTGFYAIEGNYSNSVRRVFHAFGTNSAVFIWLPGCA